MSFSELQKRTALRKTNTPYRRTWQDRRVNWAFVGAAVLCLAVLCGVVGWVL